MFSDDSFFIKNSNIIAARKYKPECINMTPANDTIANRPPPKLFPINAAVLLDEDI